MRLPSVPMGNQRLTLSRSSRVPYISRGPEGSDPAGRVSDLRLAMSHRARSFARSALILTMSPRGCPLSNMCTERRRMGASATRKASNDLIILTMIWQRSFRLTLFGCWSRTSLEWQKDSTWASHVGVTSGPDSCDPE